MWIRGDSVLKLLVWQRIQSERESAEGIVQNPKINWLSTCEDPATGNPIICPETPKRIQRLANFLPDLFLPE